MNVVLGGVAVAIALFFFGGIGWIVCRIQEWDTARLIFQGSLMVGAAVTFASLLVAMVVGLYHLYLYMFTDKRPLSLFATTSKKDE